ncbi:glycosyl hydrolase [Ideonella sp. B508-1]|uniref:WD40/YVTN/BNR-like repeat-containing protein n=1 Tax=Ideonella sp. B508-1 TaxID=137716 RepID=UPI0011D1BE0C|nr:glycosyl hydrolase [Ideonella sp. B508-1]
MAAPILGLAARDALVVAVGLRGVIVRSDDGGASFTQVPGPVGVDLTNVVLVGQGRAFAVGHRGVVLRSDDDGRTWRVVLDGRRVRAQLGMEEKGEAERSESQAAQSARRADTWPLFAVHFSDANRGLVAGAFGLLMRTEDGGETWHNAADAMMDASDVHIYGLGSTESALFLVGERGLLERRPVGSPRFHPLASPYRGSWFGVAVRNESTLVYGMRGNAYLSSDGGESWQSLDTGIQTGIVAGMLLGDASPLLVSQSGVILWGEDGKSTMQRLEAPALPYTSAAIATGRDGQRRLVLGALSGLRVLTLPARPNATPSKTS